MGFYADLHVHSKYSRATSRDCDLEHMAFWARKKGVSVVGTGDFTHPKWFAEIEEKLVPSEPGLYRLRADLERTVDQWLGIAGGEPTRFLLEVEISTIYKKDDRTRKVHHLIYAPDVEKARAFTQSLARIGNVASDGRPILGLDSRDLLEIALESGDGCYLIPAHIWTPWFAVLGSKSGFDSLEHCYGDLSGEIFAVETGLSSDPEMNRRLTSLDRYTLVSNSDAHSPPKIGREACRFDSEMDYFSMRRALETGEGYGGTVEFFPEEGKYHLDGHRKCGVCLTPEETRDHDGLCPVCGKALTLGVMYRVSELADRDGEAVPESATSFRSLIPLDEVLSEILGVGPKSKTVQEKYERLLSRLGSELSILESFPLEDVKQSAGSPLLAEALGRMREGRVFREPGFDGQYGTIHLFRDDELRGERQGRLLFDFFADTDPGPRPVPRATDRTRKKRFTSPRSPASSGRGSTPEGVAASPAPAASGVLDQLDPDQRAAAQITEGPLRIIAGPGTGKTRTLTHRLAHLVVEHGVSPRECLAITFTNRAAAEMVERLGNLLPAEASGLPVMTFHALGFSILRETASRLSRSGVERVASEGERLELLAQALSVSERQAARLLTRISRRKRQDSVDDSDAGDEESARAFDLYEAELEHRGWLDFDDLMVLPVRLLEANPDRVEHYRSRYRWVSVDEYQDIDALQYRLMKLLVPPDGNLCVIGDPDQAIYGFRGADVRHFERLSQDFPSIRTICLKQNYRSTRAIVGASGQLIAPASLVPGRLLEATTEGPERIEIHECSTERAEAEFVVHTIERMVGGSTFFSMDSGRVASHEGEAFSFRDFALLYRTDAQSAALVEALARSGMPFQKRSHVRLAESPYVRDLVRRISERGAGLAPERAVSELVEEAAGAASESDPQVEPDVELRLPAVRELARRAGQDLPRFLSELAMGLDVDLWDPRAERVSLLTLHAAKGLEFPVVFIVGCEEGLMPLTWGAPDDDELSEERRLLFVGMTRAERWLFLTHAKRRRWRGKVRTMALSPFLRDIEERLIAFHEHRPHRKAASPYKQLTLFGE